MKILKKHFPLFVDDNNCLITYKYGKLFKYDRNRDSLDTIADFKINILFEKVISRVNLLNRLLRLGIRTSIRLSSNILLICIKNKIYEYDLTNNILLNGYYIAGTGRPLYFTEIKQIEEFEDAVVFGEYCANQGKLSVSILKRKYKNNWDKIYTFKDGLINHIHNIIPDPYGKCLWILTGDTGNSMGIWRARKNFEIVEPVLVGRQEYRACMAWPTKDGLIYATDSPYEKNYLKLLVYNNSQYLINNIAELNGSVIYGCELNSNIVFSTTVEPNGIYRNKLEAILSVKKGDAIMNDYTYTYMYDGKSIRKIYRNKKDIYPFVPFQFGTIRFPNGKILSTYIPMYNLATKTNDLSTILLEL